MDLEFPVPAKGMALTHMLIVNDLDRSRNFYHDVLGAEVLRERDPCMLRLYNGWLILNVCGGPTKDKPTVIQQPRQHVAGLSACRSNRISMPTTSTENPQQR